MSHIGTGPLTSTQQRVLDLIRSNPSKHYYSGTELARLLYDDFRTAAGAHQTAASLVRRGLIAKQKVNGAVRYTRST